MILALFAFFISGATFGIIGAGGSIFTVPIMVYLMKTNPVSAVSYSFYLVGFTAFCGFISYSKQGLTKFKNAMPLAIPSVFGIIIAKYLLLPAIPEVIFGVQKSKVLMCIFAILMIVNAAAMVLFRRNNALKTGKKYTIYALFLGILIGIIIGILGIGGGFLIIPALYHLLKLDIKYAIGTSLFIIFANCALAIAIDIFHDISISYSILLPMLLASIAGMLTGVKYGKNINNNKVKFMFAGFTLVIGIAVLITEFF